MSVYLLVASSLTADPVRRSGRRGDFATATVKCHAKGGEYVLASVIAFDALSEKLLSHKQGDAVAIAGRGGIRTWQGKDDETKASLPVVADQISSAAIARPADADRRRARAAA